MPAWITVSPFANKKFALAAVDLPIWLVKFTGSITSNRPVGVTLNLPEDAVCSGLSKMVADVSEDTVATVTTSIDVALPCKTILCPGDNLVVNEVPVPTRVLAPVEYATVPD